MIGMDVTGMWIHARSWGIKKAWGQENINIKNVKSRRHKENTTKVKEGMKM